MMKIKLLLALFCCPILALAHNIKLDQPVPSVEVSEYGEVLLKSNGYEFQAWSSEQMLGKVRVIQAIAGRSSAKKMNSKMMSAITESKFPEMLYQTTSIINQDDAIWGTGNFVRSSTVDSKKDFPWSSIVLDKKGAVAKAWGLEKESSAILVQNREGKVLFVKEGTLSDDEINQVLSLIKQSL